MVNNHQALICSAPDPLVPLKKEETEIPVKGFVLPSRKANWSCTSQPIQIHNILEKEKIKKTKQNPGVKPSRTRTNSKHIC